jgi:hypothetical protein
MIQQWHKEKMSLLHILHRELLIRQLLSGSRVLRLEEARFERKLSIWILGGTIWLVS